MSCVCANLVSTFCASTNVVFKWPFHTTDTRSFLILLAILLVVACIKPLQGDLVFCLGEWLTTKSNLIYMRVNNIHTSNTCYFPFSKAG